MGFYREIKKQCLPYGDRIYLHHWDKTASQDYTYAQLFSDIDRLAGYFSTLPYPQGSRVGILSENRHEWLVTHFACLSVGWVVVPLDCRLSPPEWIHFLKSVDAKLLFLSDSLVHHVDYLRKKCPALERVFVFGEKEIKGALSFSELLPKDSERELKDQPPINLDELATIVFTSGTNGQYRGVNLTHRNLYSNAVATSFVAKHYRTRGSILPLHHMYGFTSISAALVKGNAVIFFKDLRRASIMSSFGKLRPHTFMAVPSYFNILANNIRHQADFKKLNRHLMRLPSSLYQRLITNPFYFKGLKKIVFKKFHYLLGGNVEKFISGGAGLPKSTAETFNLMGIPICEGYGLTETSPLITCGDLAFYRLGSVGKALPGIKIKIADIRTNGEGEICVQSPGVMKGYFGDPEATRQVIDSEGWFHTGDLGKLDPDGFLYITGRKKNLIVTAEGKKISPERLEDYFGQLKLAKEICVFGIPGQEENSGEVIHLEIYPDREKVPDLNRPELETLLKKKIEKLSQELPEYQRPRSFGFSDEPFPRTSSFKIKKYLVREKRLAKRSEAPLVQSEPPSDPMWGTAIGKRLFKILRRIHANGPITGQSHLTLDLGLNSLNYLELWGELEKEFGIKFYEDEVLSLREVKGVFDHLKSTLEGKTPSSRNACQDKIGSNYWVQIFEEHSEDAAQASRKILHSHEKSRKLFLKTFRRYFKSHAHLNIKNLKALPKKGPYILAPNHESHLDNLFVSCLLPKEIQQDIAVLGKKEHFDHFWSRYVAKLCHVIPVDRDQVSSSVLKMGGEILREGKILLIHPEGTRSPDGNLLPLKNGAGILATFYQCPIVPVYIEGAHEFWPKDAKWPKKGSSISVSLGRPLYPLPFSSAHPSNHLMAEAQELTDRLYRSLLAMRNGKDNFEFIRGSVEKLANLESSQFSTQ